MFSFMLISFSYPLGVCHTCKQTLPPVQLHTPFQQIPSIGFPPVSTIGGMTFAGCTTPSPQLGPNNTYDIHHMPYAHRLCQEQLVSTPIGLSHPPSVSTPSPKPIQSASSHTESFQQLFDTPATNTTQLSPPTLSPSSSPGPINNTTGYWNTALSLPSVPVSLQSSQDISAIFPTVTTNSLQLVTSPASETVYSAVPSPDTTTPIYPPYIDNTNTPYSQFTS